MKLLVNNVEFGFWENGTGKCCLMLHGNRDNKGVFSSMLPKLCTCYKVMCMDYRGHGESQITKDGYSYEQFVDDIYGILKSKGIKRVCLIGHSLGGVLALLVALKYPDMVEGLVLMATSSHFEPKFKRPAVGQKINEQMIQETNQKALPFFFQNSDNAAVQQVLNNWNQIPPYVHEKMIEMGHVDFRNKLGKLTIPSLVLYGNQDKICSISTNSIQNELCQCKVMEIPDAGHYFFMEKPNETVEQIISFIDSIHGEKGETNGK